MPTHKADLSTLSISQLTTITGRGYKTVKSRLEGLAPVSKDGRTLFYKASEALSQIYRVDDPYIETARLNRLRGDRVEHDLSIDKGESASMEILAWALSRIAELINSVLDSLPLRLKKRCPKLTARDIETIRRVIVKLQNEISEINLDTPVAKK